VVRKDEVRAKRSKGLDDSCAQGKMDEGDGDEKSVESPNGSPESRRGEARVR
jgi:hypothetical protein